MLVLIVADDPEFTSTVVARWQTERTIPEFVSLASDKALVALPACDAAIIGPVNGRDHIIGMLDNNGRPVLHMAANDADLASSRDRHPRVLTIRSHEGWVDCLITLASEALRRAEAANRAATAERALAAQQRYATLGHYMLDMRHTFNNALTSVLGNAELLLLEPGSLSSEAREQVSTIHSMGIRMHEMMQRFSSLELEMQFAEKYPAQSGQRGALVG